MELFKEKTIREHLEDMLCDRECSAEMTGYQYQAVDALIELLGYCDYDRLCELARVDKNGFCTGCTFEPSDRDDYPCTVCRRNPALTDKYEGV